MLSRFAPLVPLALVTLLFGCAAHSPVSQQSQQPQVQNSVTAQSSSVALQEEMATDKELADFAGSKPYQLPVLADSILERGMSLIGTRYRFGCSSRSAESRGGKECVRKCRSRWLP